MTIIELKSELDNQRISEKRYSLFGANLPETLVLDHQSKWLIYGIDERGGKGRVFSFDTEDEACEYFYQMMKKEKAQEEKMKNMPTYIPPQVENRTFIVSESGETNVSPDDAKKQ